MMGIEGASEAKLAWLATIVASLLFMASPAAAKVFYASAAATDDKGSGTASSPKKFLASGMALMSSAGGDTLILAAGNYSAPQDSIVRSSHVPNGKPAAYNVIKAASDGTAVLTRDFDLPLTTAYLQFEGLKWSSATSKAIAGHHIKFLRCAFKGGPVKGNAVSVVIGTNDQTPGAQYVLIEDSWVYGPGGRYKLLVYNAEYVVLRRVVVRHDAGWTYDTQNPQGGITIYNSKDVHLQNGIVIDSDLDYQGWGAGLYIVKNNGQSTLNTHTGTRIRGTILLNLKEGAIGIDGLGKVLDAKIQDSVIWGASNGLYLNNADHAVTVSGMTIGKLSKTAFGLYAGREAALDVRNSIIFGANRTFSREAGQLTHSFNNCSSNSNGTCSSPGETSYDALSNGLRYLPQIEASGKLKTAGEKGLQVGAQITHKIGSDGSAFGDAGFDVLSQERLWPWPNEARLKSDFCEDGVTRGLCARNLSLTDYIWSYIGSPSPIASVPPLAPASTADIAIQSGKKITKQTSK